MNTIQLECFIAVAEYLNFSRASEALKITQPAVSHQIRSLEEELDVPLFNRTSKTVSITPEGIRFLPDAELILKTAVSAKERLGRREQFLPFEIGCHNRMEMNLLPSILEKLTEEFPLLRPSIRLSPFPSLLNLVENKQVHASFGIKEEQVHSALSFLEITSAPMACVCSPRHPLARYETISENQLTGNIIACRPRQISEAVFSAQNRILSRLPAAKCYFTENFESALTLAKANVGYTLYPDVPAAREPDLCYVPVTDLPAAPFGVHYRSDDDHPVQKRFLSLCREMLP